MISHFFYPSQSVTDPSQRNSAVKRKIFTRRKVKYEPSECD